MRSDHPRSVVFRHLPLTSFWLTMVSAAALLTASSGCVNPSRDSSPKVAETTAPASAVAVEMVRPERTTLRLAVRQPGSIQAFEQTPVFSKIAGYVQKWHVDLGDRVRQGDVLAELTVPEMEVELRQKQALVQQSEAEIQQAKETAAAAEASLRSAAAKVKEAESGRLRARAEYKRMKSQYERLARVGQSVLDKEAIEESRYGFEAAEAGLEEVEAKVKSAEATREESAAKLGKARADVTVAEAHLRVAQENRDLVKALLQYTRLTAPFDGVVTRRSVDTGHFVQPATGTKAEPLYVVERRDFVRIFVEVPEADAGWINKGDKARVRVQALRGQEFPSEVARTSYSLDRTARTLVAEIDLPNPTDQLRPGMYVSATITAERPGVLTLPAAAVATGGDVTQGYQSYCFLVEAGKAVRTAVQVGRGDGQLVEVLKRQKPGPTPAWEEFTGTEAVAAKAAGLTDGQAVQPSAPAK
jgi:RND family efflux transporter MFP subunit